LAPAGAMDAAGRRGTMAAGSNSMIEKVLSVFLSVVLITSSLMVYGYQAPTESGSPTESAPQTASQLQALVAPIALYPDSLVAQILTASTFPDQIAIADYWI